jgi:hypothetical protein
MQCLQPLSCVPIKTGIEFFYFGLSDSKIIHDFFALALLQRPATVRAPLRDRSQRTVHGLGPTGVRRRADAVLDPVRRLDHDVARHRRLPQVPVLARVRRVRPSE